MGVAVAEIWDKTVCSYSVTGGTEDAEEKNSSI